MTADTWIRRFHPSPQAVEKLVCFPHAGGSASYFYPLSELLAPTIEVLAVQYPGRQDRIAEKCAGSITELARGALAGEPAPPFSFFGHSMGSIVAFEAARLCQQGGVSGPDRLITSGYPAPSRLRNGHVHLRDDAGLIAELRELGGVDPRWLDDADVLATVLPPLRADYQVIEAHPATAERLTGIPVRMLVGDADPHTTLAEAEAWAQATTGRFDLRVFAGGHFYLEEHLAEVAQLILTGVGETTH